jgi:hypothetical protein
MLEVLAIGSDNLVRLDALTNASTGAFVNSASVSFVLRDALGNIVVGTTAMPYVTGSNGRYEGAIPAATALVENATYTLEITATASGLVLFRKVSAIAKYRSNR